MNKPRSYFNEQLHNAYMVEVLGREVSYVDIRPESLKTETPVLFAPGWGGTIEGLEDSLKVIFDRDRRVISLTHATKGPQEFLDPELKRKYSTKELEKALALLEVLEAAEVDQADMIAHSEGAINAVIAAQINPKKFRNIVLVGPGGLVGKDKFLNLIGRFGLSALQDFLDTILKSRERKRYQKYSNQVLKFTAKNPIRSIKTAAEISENDIHDVLRELHEKGIGIAVVHGVDDPVFPMNRMQKIVKSDQLDGFVSVKGGHAEILRKPEQYIVAALSLLESLERKNIKRN